MQIEKYINDYLVKNPQLTTTEIVEATGLSRQRVHQVTARMVAEGRLVRIGSTRNLKYVLPDSGLQQLIAARPLDITRKYIRAGLDEDVVFRELKEKSNALELLPSNVEALVRWGFTEMLNNAIDHSSAQNVSVRLTRSGGEVRFRIRDMGVGVYESLSTRDEYKDEREALLELVKGKLTSKPDQHSGLGIFTTSRMADTFTLESGSQRLIRNNIFDDVSIQTRPRQAGTTINFTITTSTSRSVKEVLDRYSSVEEGFQSTEFHVRLSAQDTVFVSRSQAKVIMNGMDRFKRVVLDFKGVELVGQGFVDEVWRVWQSAHVGVAIDWVNANNDVEFMLIWSMKQ